MIKAEIFDEICDLTDICEIVKNAEDDVELVINSQGGSAFEALQLVNAIDKCKHDVVARVEVQAMSAAAVVALGCKKCLLGSGAILMLHNCWTVAVGNSHDLEQQAEACKAVDNALQTIITTYCNDENAAYIKSKMDDGELWLTGAQAADMFDNVELATVEQEQGRVAAAGSLAGLVDGYNDALAKVAELQAQLQDANVKLLEMQNNADNAQQQNYIITDQLRELLALDLE